MLILPYFRRGANLNAENVTRITPLIMAAQYECTDTLQCLIGLVEQPAKSDSAFKVLELEVDHCQILKVRKLYPLVLFVYMITKK